MLDSSEDLKLKKKNGDERKKVMILRTLRNNLIAKIHFSMTVAKPTSITNIT